MVDLSDHSALALLAGMTAATFLALGPLLPTRAGILAAQLVAGLAFAGYYAALGVTVAAAVNVLGAAQTCAAMRATHSEASRSLGYAIALLMVLVGIVFWDGPTSALSVAAMGIITLGRLQARQGPLRVMLLTGGALWIAHDLSVGAWVAMAGDIAAFAAGAIGLFWYHMRATQAGLRTA